MMKQLSKSSSQFFGALTGFSFGKSSQAAKMADFISSANRLASLSTFNH